MIETLFPETVSDILEYDVLKSAAIKYVENMLKEVAIEFSNNQMLQTMDKEKLAEVIEKVAPNSWISSSEDLITYMNQENQLKESEFVSLLQTNFPDVEYKLFDVTGFGFPETPDWASAAHRYPEYDSPRPGHARAVDTRWEESSPSERFKFIKFRAIRNAATNWSDATLKPSGRRASRGSQGSQMTSGGFGKPAMITLNMTDGVIASNGLLEIENWLDSISHKIPLNLYIEINNIIEVHTDYDSYPESPIKNAYPYNEEEIYVTNNDKKWIYGIGEDPPNIEPEPEPVPDPDPIPDPDPEPPQPESIEIGSTTTCPAGTTTLYCDYFWCYAFNNANGSNWYTPQYYESATPPITDYDLYMVGGTRYEEVVLTDGSYGTFSPTQFRLAEWSSKPEFYMDSDYYSTDSSRNGVIIKFGTDAYVYTRFALPSDMYTISGTTIIWDSSHPLMVLLNGKTAYTEQYPSA